MKGDVLISRLFQAKKESKTIHEDFFPKYLDPEDEGQQYLPKRR
jgi:hypothetical protein